MLSEFICVYLNICILYIYIYTYNTVHAYTSNFIDLSPIHRNLYHQGGSSVPALQANARKRLTLCKLTWRQRPSVFDGEISGLHWKYLETYWTGELNRLFKIDGFSTNAGEVWFNMIAIFPPKTTSLRARMTGMGLSRAPF
jgi:hypothetical protein